MVCLCSKLTGLQRGQGMQNTSGKHITLRIVLLEELMEYFPETE